MEATTHMSTGRRVKLERARHGWSQRELADRAGIMRLTIMDVELDRRLPKVQTIYKLASALDIDVEELM
jgi:transcriptional regulator with XRE-family HTH domain